jgi:hypothetical protein
MGRRSQSQLLWLLVTHTHHLTCINAHRLHLLRMHHRSVFLGRAGKDPHAPQVALKKIRKEKKEGVCVSGAQDTGCSSQLIDLVFVWCSSLSRPCVRSKFSSL